MARLALVRTMPAAVDAGASPRWALPSGTPILRRDLCGLAQPCLKQAQRTPRFLFREATVLLVAAGRLDLDDGVAQVSVPAPGLLLVAPNTCADVLKTPGGDEQRFRSLFLTLSAELLAAFQRGRPAIAADGAQVAAAFRQMPLDDDLSATLRQVFDSIGTPQLSDERLQYRLLDLLAGFAERGHVFASSGQHLASSRLRQLIGDAPQRHWTAKEAGRALAMSEATLRRRLAEERIRFEDLLIDTRMHHALMLVQTTSWNIPRIAEACGYKSRARFAERFRARFGYLPSSVR